VNRRTWLPGTTAFWAAASFSLVRAQAQGVRPTMFEFVVNQTTAKSLGLTLPPAVLLRANDVIQ